MRRALDFLFGLSDHLCRALLVVLSVTILTTVFGRYILNDTPVWSEELALTCIVWLSLLSVALSIRGTYHIRLDLVLTLMPNGLRWGTEWLNLLIGLAVGAMFVWFGWKIALQNLTNLMPGLGISAFWQYLAVPVSGVLIVIALVEKALMRKVYSDD